MKLSICLTLAMVLLILITIHFKKDSDSEPTDYILLCDNFSDGIMNSTICSSNSIFKLVPLENKK